MVLQGRSQIRAHDSHERFDAQQQSRIDQSTRDRTTPVLGDWTAWPDQTAEDITTADLRAVGQDTGFDEARELPSEEDIRDLLAEFVSISLDIRKQGVEIHQRVRLQFREISHIVTFECVDEEKRVRVDG